jgi:hypothetical protein
MRMCRKHIGVRLIGVANKILYLGRSWTLPSNSKYNWAGFWKISTDSLCLQVAQMPRSRDLAILVLTTDDRQTDTQTDCFTPAAHVRTRGNAIARCLPPTPRSLICREQYIILESSYPVPGFVHCSSILLIYCWYQPVEQVRLNVYYIVTAMLYMIPGVMYLVVIYRGFCTQVHLLLNVFRWWHRLYKTTVFFLI